MTEPESNEPNPNEIELSAGEAPDASATDSTSESDGASEVVNSGPQRGPRVFGKYATLIVVVPFIVYLCGMMAADYVEKLRIGQIEGSLHDHTEGNRLPVDKEELYENVDPNEKILFGLLYLSKESYPYTYSTVIAITTLVMLCVCWGYFKVPLRFSVWGVLTGVVGVVLWIGLAKLDEMTFNLGGMMSSGRPAFNPFESLKDNPTWMWQFLAIRFFGLVVVVPIVEEFFIRGFLIRYVDDPDWDEMPIADAKPGGWISPTIYGVVAHLTEPVAAIVWFSMVTLLFRKTKSIWDCVLAHAITNLLLGLYVVKFGAWELW